MKCDGCELQRELEDGSTNYVPGRGDTSSPIVLVGEAPGKEEVLHSQPFVGAAGKVLQKILDELGVSRKALYITNSCKCRPPSNRTPTWDEMMSCRMFLSREIAGIRPKVIVTLGSVALQTITKDKKAKLKDYIGQVWTSEEFGCQVVSTYHPAFALPNRNPDSYETIKSGIKSAIAVVRGETAEDENGELSYQIIKDLREFSGLMSMLQSESRIAFDTETGGFSYWEDPVACIQLTANGTKAYIIPVFTELKNFWDPVDLDHIKRGLSELLTKPDTTWIGQNLKFDIEFLMSLGLPIPEGRLFDTMLFHHLIDEESFHDLESIAQKYLGWKRWDLDLKRWIAEKKKEKQKLRRSIPEDRRHTVPLDVRYTEIPPRILFPYAAMDALAAFQLSPILEAEMDRQKLWKIYETVTEDMIRTITSMEYRGALVDLERVEESRDFLEKELSRIQANSVRCVGKNINMNSTKQVPELLFGELKLPVKKLTDKGKPSADKKVLDRLRTAHPIVPIILEYREKSKLYGYYSGDRSFIRNLDQNNRVHTNYKIHGTKVGRLSSSEPSLHTIPKKGPLRKIIRAGDGFKFVEADYGQAEIRIAGFLSQDELLLRDLAAADIHRVIAGRMFKKDPEMITDEERSKGKTGVFGTLYGGVQFLMEGGMTEKEAYEIRDLIRGAYPVLRGWMNETIRATLREGEMTNLFGRKRHFNIPRNISKYELATLQKQIIHFPCASLASDMLSYSLVRIHKELQRRGSEAFLIMTLHDALFLEIPEQEVDEIVELIGKIMTQSYEGLSLPVKIEIGDRWGDPEREVVYEQNSD